MIIMPVPKDIRTFKPKFIGPFTKRQTFALIPAGLIAALLIGFGRKYIGLEIAAFLVIVIDAPIIACGFIDIQGMPFSVFMKDVVTAKLLYPTHRLYKTENTFERYTKQNRITYAYFDGDVEEYTGSMLKRKQKEYKRRYEMYLKEHPEMRPIE